MENESGPAAKSVKSRSTVSAILNGICPACREGVITTGIFGMKKVCPHCGYDLQPESGYYLGAMMVGFLATSLLTVPPMIALKVYGVDDRITLTYPFVQYAVLGPLLIHYAKIIWVHLAYRATLRMK